MKIGIPRALFYHINPKMWLAYFEKLGVEVVLSPETNQKIFNDGIALSIDESCLSSKVFMGHVKWLAGKCDKIFIPHIESFGPRENACPKFSGMYDIVKNTLDVPLISFNINANYGFSEEKAYISLGKQLGFSSKVSRAAFLYAIDAQENFQKEQERIITKQLESSNLKVLVVSHYYNTHDEYIGKPIIRSLKKHGAEVILACDAGVAYKCGHERFTSTSTWKFGKELLGTVNQLKDKVDGIVVVSTFPCGPDSMLNDFLRLEQKTVPMITLVLDELQGQTGVETRIESFIDILSFEKLGDFLDREDRFEPEVAI